ncbi:GMC family oxidoreductase [soil metagenome]
MSSSLPSFVDTLILGGGTSGAVVAARIAETTGESVLVAEAGPDYGALREGRWPADLVDASALAATHDWGYSSASTYADRAVPFQRARVIGGCSSHNGCAAIWGHRLDYDAWAAAGNEGWSTDDLLPYFVEATNRMRVHHPLDYEATPFQQACLDAASMFGVPRAGNLNDLDDPVGMALSPVNIVNGQRWNSAFAYLDPIRDRPNLTVVGNHLADRLLLESSKVVGARLIGPNGPVEVRATRTIVSGGAYGSPAILLRSGIGNPNELRSVGVTSTHELLGVGKNLHDHPSATLEFAGTETLRAMMTEHRRSNWSPEEQAIAKLRSSRCEDDAFDLHLYPVGGPYAPAPHGWRFAFPVACMTPKLRGEVRLTGIDPEAALAIDHRYLNDFDGHDAAVLVDGIEIAKEITRQNPLAALLGEELAPFAGVSKADLEARIRSVVEHYYHPVGTCKMGPSADPDSVVDNSGAIHGLEGVYVADCSIMPVVPRANTNIPAIVVGERIASFLIGD